MRLATKGTLAFLALYCLVLGGAAIWLELQLRAMATAVIDETSRLIGTEVAKAIAEPAVNQMMKPGPQTREKLEQIVDDVTAHSAFIASVAVVDRNGIVLASDGVGTGSQRVSPQVLFQGTREIQTVKARSGNGDYHLFVPLVKSDIVIGYLRLSIRSRRIARLYAHGRREFLLAAVGGLFAVGLFGLLLHIEVTRRSRAVAHALERAVRGHAIRPTSARDEFAQALDTAQQIGRELTTARQEGVQARQRLGALLKAMNAGVLLLDAERRLEFANQTARDLLDCSGAGELERRWDHIKAHLGKSLPTPRDDGSEEDQTSSRLDVELPSEGGPRRLRFEVYPLEGDETGGCIVLVNSCEMIEALEKELGLAIQMRGLGRFYAAFAHDLKAPLNAMVMNLELLKQSLLRDGASAEAASRDRQLRYMGVLREEISRFDRQLRTLLSHVASSNDTTQELDLCDIVRDLTTLLDPQARRQRVSLTTQLPDEPIPLQGNRDRIKQALLNILINALEAMPNGGELTIALRAHDGRAEVAVRDSGPGIPPNVLENIYDMQFTTKTGGTGVGLYVARAVVEAHRGSIHVNSRIGGGTCFQLDFPLVARERTSEI